MLFSEELVCFCHSVVVNFFVLLSICGCETFQSPELHPAYSNQQIWKMGGTFVEVQVTLFFRLISKPNSSVAFVNQDVTCRVVCMWINRVTSYANWDSHISFIVVLVQAWSHFWLNRLIIGVHVFCSISFIITHLFLRPVSALY